MRQKLISKLKLFIGGFLTLNIVWYIAALLINRKILVNPLSVYKDLPELMPNLGRHISASMMRIFWGVLIASIVGIVIGILLAYSKKISRFLNPFIYFAYPIPKLALLPVLMLLLGLGDATKIAMVVLIIVFQIIVAVRDAVLNIPGETYHILISKGASYGQILRYITLPAILPECFTSLRIAIGTAISVLFFTETYGTREGLGYFIMDAWMRLDYTAMYGAIIILSCIGFLLFMIIDLLNEYMCKWK